MIEAPLDPVELLAACLDAIARREAEIGAWVLLDRAGAMRAAEAAADRARQGRSLGPLDGMPIGIKDIVDVSGWPTRAGSPLREQHIAPQDAPLVARLRRAGAILVGKTVTTQFACFDPPSTRNPHNQRHTPGGSSSGSAAAVAAGMCVGAVGTQTGGSIVRPAAYCGVVGFKPTWGAVPLEGVVPVSARLDHAGPFARCVSHAAVLYQVMAGLPCNELPSLDAAPPRLHVLRDFFLDRCDGDMAQQFTRRVELLEAFADLPLPEGFDDVHHYHRRLMAADAARVHRSEFQQHRAAFAPQISALIEEGMAISQESYQEACRHQIAFRAAVRDWLPPDVVVLTPATPGPAPGRLDTTGDPSFNSPWSYAGLPTATVPAGLVDGMPWGLQCIGAADQDERVLAAAQWCERRLSEAGLTPPPF